MQKLQGVILSGIHRNTQAVLGGYNVNEIWVLMRDTEFLIPKILTPL